ncbi:ATP-dependent helicase HrpB [Arthrobacter sp. zg-Y859]|uniref:ATP-dependent helicase HrpB n=1 Tax=Arthrobacter jinronghuae TaxID=2964609 RepID=A0ABT1NQM2_9MICC|nr:ATP-dependent helicase HrpB [Arthrobacter jinronghuae]MCQ1950033.1 ATP-dependent helicase HrpB [Arthrobacter jinronghuae]UWX80174.1 ATP-dependent helicase HrpB [Arthrobacter jinronghuae]
MTSPASPRPTDPPFNIAAIGGGLVFAESVPQLAAVLGGGSGEIHGAGTAVVQAPPGTGKTTLVPPLVANVLARGGTQPRVVVTQPRRVAVRSAARRLAALDGTALGGRVGYTVRGESRTGPSTLVEFVTPGILLRRLLADPGMEGTAAVILDEVHERGLETDLLLGMLTEVRQLREDLTLVAMSATLDAPRFAALIGSPDGAGPAPVVGCPAALHPLRTVWAPAPVPRFDERGVTRGFLDHVADTALQAHSRAVALDPDIDALVFVPGAREVSTVASRLRSRVPAGTEVLELHGQISPAEQDRAVSGRAPGEPARIIVSTSLAESSLTVPGVRLVVDSGLAREPRRDAMRGMSGLVTVSCSRASAEQRAGRAARLGPGTVVRCYDDKAYGAAPAHQTPEIAVADLTSAALVLACWGAPGGEALSLPDAPPPAAMRDAVQVLRGIGAVDAEGLATARGKTLARVPADPRLARALLDGAGAVGARTAAEVVALLSGDNRAPGADLPRLLAGMRAGREPGDRRWSEDVRRLDQLARREKSAGPAERGAPGAREIAGVEAPGYVIALAFPDRIARRVPGAGSERYLLASGTRAGLPAGSSLTGQDWLAVADVARAEGRDAAGTGAVIRSAAPLTLDTAEAAAEHLVTDTVEAEFAGGRVTARRERRLGAILLGSTPVRPSAEEGRAAVARALTVQGLDLIGFSAAADALRRRLALLHRELGEPWPDVSEPALLDRLQDWLGPELDALARGASANSIDLTDALRRLLPWPDASRLGDLVPERLQVPSGSRVRIDYPDPEHDDGRPVVAVKLQECFGWSETPRLVEGRVPVLFHLLSPAGRPLAVTDDLASFWSGPYAQVRSEMRGRYPRHPWPEDPWSAKATARTKARM